MSGDDEDRLDFGEDEELEDQISLGDADEAPVWQGAQQQDMQIDAQVVKQSSDSDAGQVTGPASQAVSEENSKEASLPAGWVTRVSRQGEMYYFHEATLTSQWDRPTAPMKASPKAVESKPPAPTRSELVQDVAAASTSQGMSLYSLQERRVTAKQSITPELIIDYLPHSAVLPLVVHVRIHARNPCMLACSASGSHDLLLVTHSKRRLCKSERHIQCFT